MNLPIPEYHDVLIAGAGPVGLFLACELALAGFSVLVIEQAGPRLDQARKRLWRSRT